jgi:hypothetical protein
MRDDDLATDADVTRARHDPAFRQQLLIDNLERLLVELERLRPQAHEPLRAQQIREGAELAVKLADLLQRITLPPRAA